MWTWERTQRDNNGFRSATQGEFRGWYRNLAHPQLSLLANIGTQCVWKAFYNLCGDVKNVFIVYQLLGKLENTDEDLKEERRRHEETRNQLETTKRQLEAAEKVKQFVKWLEHAKALDRGLLHAEFIHLGNDLPFFFAGDISANFNVYWLCWRSTNWVESIFLLIEALPLIGLAVSFLLSITGVSWLVTAKFASVLEWSLRNLLQRDT